MSGLSYLRLYRRSACTSCAILKKVWRDFALDEIKKLLSVFVSSLYAMNIFATIDDYASQKPGRLEVP